MAVYNKWLGFGDFERKYGDDLWVMLESSARIRPTLDTATPKSGRRGRSSTGKGKSDEEVDAEAAKSSNTPYDSFWDDQERFLSHALSLGLDFIFPHYLALLSSPYLSEELYISIANKATQHTCTIDDTPNLQITDIQIPAPPATTQLTTDGQTTNGPSTDDVIKTDSMDSTTNTTTNTSTITTTDSEVISDSSNDSFVLPSSQDAHHSSTSQPPQVLQTKVVFVEKDSKVRGVVVGGDEGERGEKGGDREIGKRILKVLYRSTTWAE